MEIRLTEKLEKCPYCESLCEADFVDNGIAMIQCGPYHCDNCGSSEIGPHDKSRELTEEENKTGWYKPGSAPGSSANVINGKVVSADLMEAEYKKEFTDNPLWHDKKYVEDWHKKTREKK